jgi:hypothetical protein
MNKQGTLSIGRDQRMKFSNAIASSTAQRTCSNAFAALLAPVYMIFHSTVEHQMAMSTGTGPTAARQFTVHSRTGFEHSQKRRQ